MRVVVSVIYEVAAFLVHEPHSNPRETPRSPCAFDGFTGQLPSASDNLGLSDYLLSSLSTALGLELPRAVTVLNGLPLATSLLLRLTEVLPSELILFFCLTGMIFWLVCACLCCVILVCTSGLLFQLVCRPPRAVAHWLTSWFANPPPSRRPPRLEAAPARPRLPPVRPAALSDEVRTFVEDVRAHNPISAPSDGRRRSARRSSRPQSIG